MKKMVVLISAVALVCVVIGCRGPKALTAYPEAKAEKLDMLGAEWSVLDNEQDSITDKKNKREQELIEMGNPPEKISGLLAALQDQIDDLAKKKKKIQDKIKRINDAKITGEKKKVFLEVIKPNLEKRIKKLTIKLKNAPNQAARDRISEEIQKLKMMIVNSLNEFGL